MRRAIGLAMGLALGLAGCGDLRLPGLGIWAERSAPRPEVRAPGAETQRPVARPVAGVPPAGAQTVDVFDTASVAERQAAALARSDAPDRLLGTTVATLGDPADPGFWARTPLVDRAGKGRLVHTESGRSVLVDLRPRDAAPGAGTQVSLAALRVLGLPLTALVELSVHARLP